MKKYITTSIVYPNANPHIGYALELVQADFLARYYRQQGNEVYFLTGVDEHGLKIQRAAFAAGQSPEQFTEEKAAIYRQLTEVLGISADRFIRTSDADHIKMAQIFWRQCEQRGDIYKQRYQAWYNVKEEEFLGSLAEHPDPNSFGIDPRFIEKIDEENYFFRLSRYEKEIVELLQSGHYQVIPSSRAQELFNFVSTHGLQDISISREKSRLQWGIPVPGDDTQVIYVWFDALINYLTATAEVKGDVIVPRAQWPADVHCVGKDIHRFHGLIWPGMLLSAGLELPKQLLVHGFLTAGGAKMSKSLGNVIDPFQVVAKFGLDPLRWYLLKEVPTTGDADFTQERLEQVFLADLANDFGNLVSRVWTMVQKYNEGRVPEPFRGNLAELGEQKGRLYHHYIEQRQIHLALAAVQDLVVAANRRIEEEKPWVLAKDPKQKLRLDNLLYELIESIRQLSILLAPALPGSCARLDEDFFAGVEGVEWGALPAGHSLGSEPLILFPKQ